MRATVALPKVNGAALLIRKVFVSEAKAVAQLHASHDPAAGLQLPAHRQLLRHEVPLRVWHRQTEAIVIALLRLRLYTSHGNKIPAKNESLFFHVFYMLVLEGIFLD